MKLATSGSKENIQKLVNQYFYTNNYIIDDNNNIIHSQTGKCLDNFKIECKKGRWIFSNNV